VTRTRIKFCGMTRAHDIDAASRLGVDYIGLVFVAGSRRSLGLEQGRQLRAQVPAGIASVALVMDAAVDQVQAIVDQVRPDLLQFHGAEDDAFCAGFGLPFLKVAAMGGQSGDAARVAAAGFPSAVALVLDGHAPGSAGGSGQAFDWTGLPTAFDKSFLLAGGLCPDNVGLAIRAARPWGVDVSSGIEQAPGVKDGARMQAFVDEVRRAESAIADGN